MKLKILHVLESYLPQVHGMSEVVRQLSERLVEMGHDVTVATSMDPARSETVIRGVKVIGFNITGNAVWGIWGEKEAYQDFLKKSDFHILGFFAAHQWATDLALPILSEIQGKKVFVPTGFSGFYQPVFQKYFHNLKTTMKEFDHSVFLSHDYRDINFAREIGIKNLSVIPNGADEKEFQSGCAGDFRESYAIGQEEILMLTVGSHTGKKGHKEAISILKSLKTKKKVTLFVVGNLPDKGKGTHKLLNLVKALIKKIISYQGGGDCLQSCLKEEKLMNRRSKDRRLIVRKIPRSETLKAFFASDLFLFPSNIECSPVVLFEANAAKLPFFVTDVGNSREIVQWTGGGKVLPTYFNKDRLSYAKILESAEQIDSYIDNPEQLKELGETGYLSWKQNFTWDAITLKYEKLYLSLLA